jgi:hypothetical protein
MKRIHFTLGFVVLLAFDTVSQVGFKLTGNNVMPIEPNFEGALGTGDYDRLSRLLSYLYDTDQKRPGWPPFAGCL